jgi:ubiquinone/menaquinone biosynthesis C-methylase UbiE
LKFGINAVRNINYDKVAIHYDGDWSGLYTSARAAAIEQIAAQHENTCRCVDTIDLGIGTGSAFCALMDRINLGYCAGFDLSRGMLSQASTKLENRVQLFHDDALSAPRHLGSNSQDLVLCHFMLSFFKVDQLLATAFQVLRPGGYLSITNNTCDSMSELHRGRFERVSRLLGIESSLEKSSNPVDHADCQRQLQAAGFEIVDALEKRRSVWYRSYRDVRAWGIDSGWLVNSHDASMGLRIAGGKILFGLAKVFMHPLYPIHATSKISIVLARKPNCAMAYHPAHLHMSGAGGYDTQTTAQS